MLLQHYDREPVAVAPRRRLEFCAGPYVVKLAETPKELESAIRLRSKVFRADFGALVATDDPLWDFGELDRKAEHLIVVNRSTGATVGTYRLILSHGTEGFYSQSEFNLSHLLDRPGLKLELSRACVDSEHRDGSIVILLWKGLTEVVRMTGASLVFGLSSLLTEDPARVYRLLDHFHQKGSIEESYGIRVLPHYAMEKTSPSYEDWLAHFDPEAMIAPLLRMYLKAGAKLAPEPAHDRDFRCVDLLTVLEVSKMNESMARRYGLRVDC